MFVIFCLGFGQVVSPNPLKKNTSGLTTGLGKVYNLEIENKKREIRVFTRLGLGHANPRLLLLLTSCVPRILIFSMAASNHHSVRPIKAIMSHHAKHNLPLPFGGRQKIRHGCLSTTLSSFYVDAK